MAHTVTVSSALNTIPMQEMKRGQIARIANGEAYEGEFVIRQYGDAVTAPFVTLHDGDTFNRECPARVEVLPPGTVITITVGD